MKKSLAVSVVAVSICAFIAGGALAAEDKARKTNSGEAEFKEHCAVCHPEGGNIVNPARTLHKKDLDANGILKPADIIAKMRNPGPGMTKFDKATVNDKEALAIAKYILKAFK